VYASDLAAAPEGLVNGCLADVVSEKGTYLGTGFYSQKSKIAVRLLSSNANDRYDEAFFARRIQYALDYRVAVSGRATFPAAAWCSARRTDCRG